MVDQVPRATRSADDPLNFRPKAARLEVRKNFFSSRVTENWSKIPSHVKNVKKCLQEKLQKSESWLLLLRGKRFEGKMEGWSTTRGRHSPRGPSGTTGSSSPSIQVSSYGTVPGILFPFVWNLQACSLKFNSKLLGDTGAMPEFVRIPV